MKHCKYHISVMKLAAIMMNIAQDRKQKNT
jgi:hypothetical protein